MEFDEDKVFVGYVFYTQVSFDANNMPFTARIYYSDIYHSYIIIYYRDCSVFCKAHINAEELRFFGVGWGEILPAIIKPWLNQIGGCSDGVLSEDGVR